MERRLFHRSEQREPDPGERKAASSRAHFEYTLTLWAVLLASLIPLGLHATTRPQPLTVFAGGVLVAVAAAMAGSIIGFLFGLPRATQRAQDASASTERSGRPNTNLEDVSDWVTKILVGVGLTQLGPIIQAVERLVAFCRQVLGDGAEAAPLAAALMLIYFVAGFLLTYLFTRTELEAEFYPADTREMTADSKAVRAAEAAAHGAI